MELWFSAWMGLVQGLTEFLPISSTAHLRITPELFGMRDPGAAFSAVIQLGTLLAVLAYFARDLLRMAVAMFKDPSSPDGKLPWFLMVGTMPIVACGLGLKDYITGPFRSLYVVAGALISVGVVMALIDARAERTRTAATATLFDVFLIGLAQAMALVPGVSRSGSTIIAALALGFARPDAARLSFLLGIPAIAGAGLYEIPAALAEVGDWPAVVVGTLAAAVSGYAAIAWLLRYLSRKTLAVFAGYRVVVGVLLVLLCMLGVLSPSAE